jgi:hypothetical protein
MRRIEREACGVDERPVQFSSLDAAADGKRVGRIGAYIDNGCKSAAQKHIGELRVQRGGGLPFREVPFGLGEMNMGVPEAGRDNAMVAGHEGGA